MEVSRVVTNVGCKSASVQLAREAAIAKLPSIIQPFLATAHKLNKPPTSPDAPPPPLLGLPATTIEFLKNFPTSWEAATQKERDTILYHLVLSSPWPPSATPDEWHLAKALALAFEKIYITVVVPIKSAKTTKDYCYLYSIQG